MDQGKHTLKLILDYDGEDDNVITSKGKVSSILGDIRNSTILNNLKNFPIEDDIKLERYSDSEDIHRNCRVNISASSSVLNFVSEVFVGFDSSSEDASTDVGDYETPHNPKSLTKDCKLNRDLKQNERLKIKHKNPCEPGKVLHSSKENDDVNQASKANMNVILSVSKQRKKTKKTHTCHICSKKFHYDWALMKHINRHSNWIRDSAHQQNFKDHNFGAAEKYVCESCGKKFQRKGNFTRHVQKCGRPGEVVSSPSYLCNKCGKMCGLRWQLKQHMMYHNDIRPFPCDLCHKKFRYSSRLKEHRRTHLGLRPHKCKLCPRSFNTVSELHKHGQRHNLPGYRMYNRETDPKKLETCTVCCRLVVNLHAHMYTHTDSKDVRCNICNKAFKSMVSLYAHVKLHSGVMAFSCDVCGRKFSRRSNMLSHRVLHLKPTYKPKTLSSRPHTSEKTSDMQDGNQK